MTTRLLLLVVPFIVIAAMVAYDTRSQADEVQNPTSPKTDNPVEVGHVRWGRDLDAALQLSADTGKPVFVLFQEVPGCQGCQDFGQSVLTEPLLVEAIEDEFIPVLVINNRLGQDRQTLKRFNEPAWNYQVIRFLDADANDIIPRKDRVWTTPHLRSRMVAALTAAERPVPQYLHTVAAEHNPGLQTAAFAMFCFWVGEADLGALPGVISTEAGWYDGKEVTRVLYDPNTISLNILSQHARTARCAATQTYTTNHNAPNQAGGLPVAALGPTYRPARTADQSRQLIGYDTLTGLPGLTEMQRTKLNALLRTDPPKALTWLSPRQFAILQQRINAQ
ncbi:MAG: VPGUxxT family thioredoxin-like (seleno)protein, type 2 [Planctomycetota bacterium]